MIEDDDIQIFSSQLDPELTVMIVYPGSTRYSTIEPQFRKSGHGFILHEAKAIMIDGSVVEEDWFTIDHLMVIQAHEIGHYRAEHAINENAGIDIEKEADWLGYKLLSSLEYESAAQLHKEEYRERYGTDPDHDSVKFKEKLGKLI